MNKKLLVILLICIAFFLTYLPHLDYKLPTHVDEWNAIYFAEELKSGEYPHSLGALRIGFYAFLAALPFNLVETYHLFPAIWAALSAVVLLFVFKEKLGFTWAYLASLFFILIKSNIATLGHWFFTPLTFSIPFLLWLHYSYSKLIKNPSKQQLLYTSIPAALLLFAYPIAPIFYFVTQFFTFSWIKLFQNNNLRKFLIVTSASSFVIGTTLLFATLQTNPFLIIIQYGIIPIDWFGINPISNPLDILTWVGFLTALVGIISTIYTTKTRKKYKEEIAWLITGIVWISLATITKYSVLVPLERVIFFTAIITCVFSAIGVKFIYTYSKKTMSKKIQITLIVTLLILTLLLFKPLYYDYIYTPQGKELYHPISEEEYDFLIHTQWQENQTILAPVYTSVAIKTLTDADTVIHPPFVADLSKVEEVTSFYQPIPCAYKDTLGKELIEQYSVTHIYAKREVSCLKNQTELITQTNSMFLYKVIR